MNPITQTQIGHDPIAAIPNLQPDTKQNATSSWAPALCSALFAFALSRFLVVMAAALTFAFTTQWWNYHEAGLQDMRVFTADFLEKVKTLVLQDDAGLYLEVVRDGYETRPFDTHTFANWAFFPLHPWIWRVTIAIGIPPWLSGLVLANVFFFLALVQIHRWVSLTVDQATAERAVLCVALFPTAYFFAMPFSEPLYILLASSCLLSIERKRWSWAAGFAALCSGTRVVGVLLTPLLWWYARRDLSFAKRTLLSAIGATGLIVFMAVLWHKTGNPLAFADIQVAWGRNGNNWLPPLIAPFTKPTLAAESWNAVWITSGSLILGLAAAVWLWLRKLHAYALYALACLLLPWSSGSMMGMSRYVNVCLPVFLALAVWLKRPYGLLTWLILSACLLVWMTGCFTLGATFAGA
jgi:Gpi18-like mannosyltransferase